MALNFYFEFADIFYFYNFQQSGQKPSQKRATFSKHSLINSAFSKPSVSSKLNKFGVFKKGSKILRSQTPARQRFIASARLSLSVSPCPSAVQTNTGSFVCASSIWIDTSKAVSPSKPSSLLPLCP